MSSRCLVWHLSCDHSNMGDPTNHKHRQRSSQVHRCMQANPPSSRPYSFWGGILALGFHSQKSTHSIIFHELQMLCISFFWNFSCQKRPGVMPKVVNKNKRDMFTSLQCWFWRERKLENGKESRDCGWRHGQISAMAPSLREPGTCLHHTFYSKGRLSHDRL